MAADRTDNELREAVLLAAIVDIQGAIRANDAKCSAALVVHGLLFAGSLGIAPRFGPVFVAASKAERAIAVILLLIASIAFVVSVYFLLRALRPYRVEDLDVVDEESPGVFFPLPEQLGQGAAAWEMMKKRVAQLGSDNVVTELARERVKLGYILRFESDNAKMGYHALYVEVVAAVAFLIMVAGLAATQAT